MTRPETCEDCGEAAEHIEGHHEDYTRPSEVRWLCRPCHGKADTARRRRERASRPHPVLRAAMQLQQARDNLRVMLGLADHGAPDFPETLAFVRDAGVITTVELAAWSALPRARLYYLLAEHDDERKR